MSVVISFLQVLSFLFPVSFANHSIAARLLSILSLSLPLLQRIFLIFFCVFIVSLRLSRLGYPPLAVAPPPRVALRTWSLIVPNFLIFCMATATDCATTICTCSVTNLSLRSPPAVCSRFYPRNRDPRLSSYGVSNTHPVVHFRVFLSAFSPFRLFAFSRLP